MTDLVQRLRQEAWATYSDSRRDLLTEAAARIEALEADEPQAAARDVQPVAPSERLANLRAEAQLFADKLRDGRVQESDFTEEQLALARKALAAPAQPPGNRDEREALAVAWRNVPYNLQCYPCIEALYRAALAKGATS